MSDTSRPPLWREIDRAWWSLVDTGSLHALPPESDQAACVIRALRDWLVPEGQPEPKCKEPTYEWVQWNDRQHLRALLTAEADRAALAAAPGVEPSDELLSIDDLREAWDAQSDAFNSWDQLGVDEIAWWAQRQALARWGRYPAPPAEGEDYQERPTARSVAMTDLSPAAQAVLDAFNREARPEPHHQREAIAAALRAAADQVEQKLRGFSHEACQEIRSIATELEGHHG